jgi:hypothetical protein
VVVAPGAWCFTIITIMAIPSKIYKQIAETINIEAKWLLHSPRDYTQCFQRLKIVV